MFKFENDYLDSPSDIMGGFDRVAYIALTDWILQWPGLDPIQNSDSSLVTLLGDFVLAPDKYFIQVAGRSGLNSDTQGERDCTSVNNAGQLFRSGTDDENIALHRKLNGAYGVIIFTDGVRGDDRVVVGDRICPCWFSAKVGYGTNAEDPKGLTINYEADGFVAGYKYHGAIPTREKPASVFTIEVNPPSATMPQEGGYIDVTVVATRDGQRSAVAWRTPPDGFSVSYRGGDVYRITAIANTRETSQSVPVTFYAVGSYVTDSVVITQPGVIYDISVDPVDIHFPSAGGSREVVVTATKNGVAIAYQKKLASSWLTPTPGNPATIVARQNYDIAREGQVVWEIPGSGKTAINKVIQDSYAVMSTYVGVVNEANPDEFAIKSLPYIQSDNSDVVRSFTTQKQYIALYEPSSFDPFVKIVDDAGFDKTNAFRQYLVTIDGVEYRGYITKIYTTGTQSFTFKK